MISPLAIFNLLTNIIHYQSRNGDASSEDDDGSISNAFVHLGCPSTDEHLFLFTFILFLDLFLYSVYDGILSQLQDVLESALYLVCPGCWFQFFHKFESGNVTMTPFFDDGFVFFFF